MLFQLNSHNHKRGKRFRVFEGRYVCNGGRNNGAACSPLEEVSLELPDSCEGAPCVSFVPPPIADCDGNGRVTIGELTTCVNIALGNFPRNACPPADPDEDGKVTIAELISSVRAALAPPEVIDGEAELLYTNLVYNDPTVVNFDPPRAYSSAAASAVTRTLTYCSLFDNGATNSDEVKRRSTSPPTPFGAVAPGGPCAQASACTEGRVGASCNGNSQAAHRSCDSTEGAGDGFCDACTLRGGVTTEDEMFILMGGFFVEN